MKKLLALLVLLPSLAFAKPVSFEFAGVSLVTFAQATFKSIMNRDYVISPEALALDRKITMSVKNIDVADVPRFVENLLQQQGIATTLKEGLYYLSAARPQETAQERVSGAVRSSVVEPSYNAAVDRLAAPWAEPQLRSSFDGASTSSRRPDDEFMVYVPINRTSDFLAGVVAAAFGKHAAMAAGSKVVLTGSKADLAKMAAVIESLDAVPRMLDVSASWIEVTESNGAARGISIIANLLGAKFGTSLGAINSGSAITLKNTNFELVIDALNSDGRFKQVSNSRILGDDFEKFALNVGDETPTISSTGKDNSGNYVQNIVYRPSGVIVDVWAKLLGGGKINLVIDGQISSFKATVNGVSGSPTLIKRQVKTAVTVGDGDVLVIGGLTDAQTTDSTSGFSFLPASWSVKSGTKTQTDLVLVLSAKVVQ